MNTLRDWHAGETSGGPVRFRLIVGALQGIALFLLDHADRSDMWLAHHPLVAGPLNLVVYLIPVLLIVGAGTIRPRTLAIWALSATVAVAALGYYAVWRDDQPIMQGDRIFGLVLVLAGALLLVHALIAAADGTGRIIAPYARFFAALLKQLIEIILGGLFVLALWLVLTLGSELFNTVGIAVVQRVIQEPVFKYPVFMTALALAIHVVDRRTSLVTSIRTLALTLLGALLPVLTLGAAGFLATLPFIGFEPLWDTGNATGIVLSVAAVLAALINAVYQDGATERVPSAFLRVSAMLASVVIAVLVALAGYAVALRVMQYGWTAERITAASVILVALWIGVGYSLSLFRPKRWMRSLPATNFGAVAITLTLVLALFSPVADPARLAVWDQTRRLEAGLIDPDMFDFKFLRFDSGRFGRAVLNRLTASSDTQIAKQASVVAALENPYDMAPIDARSVEDNITVYPDGATIPKAFFATDWSKIKDVSYIPDCLVKQASCEARFINLDADKDQELLMWDETGGRIDVFDQQADGWHPAGMLWLGGCEKAYAQLRNGPVKALEPKWKDFELLGSRLRIEYTEERPSVEACSPPETTEEQPE